MIKNDIRKLLTENLTISVGEAGEALGGLSRNASYRAVKTGEIPSIRIGGRIVVPTAPLRKMLRMDEAASFEEAGSAPHFEQR